MSVKPITPGGVASQKGKSFPDAVFEAFNEIITANCINGRAAFTVNDVVKLMVLKGIKKLYIFDKRWLDIEEVYTKAGWKVVYDQPAYNESYEANFTFTAKRKS